MHRRRRRVVSGLLLWRSRSGVLQGAGVRALRAREVAWRHAGSTRNEVRLEVQAVAAEVQHAEKRGDAPFEVPNQRVHEGVEQLDLDAQVERDEGRLVVDDGRSGRRDRGTRF